MKSDRSGLRTASGAGDAAPSPLHGQAAAPVVREGRRRADEALERVSEAKLVAGISRTPLDEYVIWIGTHYRGRRMSIRARVLSTIAQSWTPISVRMLVRAAARLAGDQGFSPDRVRAAIRMHQTAEGASYFLVRRTADGDFVAVTDVPMPAAGRPLRAGDRVLGRTGARFGEDARPDWDAA